MLIVANFKANLTIDEVNTWIDNFYQQQLTSGQKDSPTVVVCPSFISLSSAYNRLKQKSWNYPVYLGAQSLSQYPNGSYTAEVTGQMLKDLVRYVIVGHSERRRFFNESNDAVNNKIQQAQEAGITPIVCVSTIDEVNSVKSKFSTFTGVFAYEPLTAIGTGKAETPEIVEEFVKSVQSIFPSIKVLYGGSVTSANIGSYTKIADVFGVLIGKSSLDPSEFSTIIACAE